MKNTKNKIIRKDMLIVGVMQRYPHLIETMIQHGLHCVGCYVATWETLEQGATNHGINVDRLVDDLNKKVRVR